MRTLKEIADACGTSISTVSLALRKPHKISKEVRHRIYATIRQNGYSKISSEKVTNIGILINNFADNFQNEFYNEVIEGIFERAAEYQHNIRLFRNFDVDYSEIYDLQGFIFVGKTPDAWYEQAEKFRMPVLNCGHPSNNYPHIPAIYLERRNTTKMLIDFVTSCGHKNIAVVLGDSQDEIIQAEFLNTIAENNPHFNEDFIFQADYENIQTVEIIWNKIISHQPGFTAIMCVNDLLAYYIYQCAEKYHKTIPTDISVTGFDGITIPRYIKQPEPKLTTVFGDKKQMGRKALEIITNYLTELPFRENHHIKLPSYLTIGESVTRI